LLFRFAVICCYLHTVVAFQQNKWIMEWKVPLHATSFQYLTLLWQTVNRRHCTGEMIIVIIVIFVAVVEQNSLNLLMNQLGAAQPHFIRFDFLHVILLKLTMMTSNQFVYIEQWTSLDYWLCITVSTDCFQQVAWYTVAAVSSQTPRNRQTVSMLSWSCSNFVTLEYWRQWRFVDRAIQRDSHSLTSCRGNQRSRAERCILHCKMSFWLAHEHWMMASEHVKILNFANISTNTGGSLARSWRNFHVISMFVS